MDEMIEHNYSISWRSYDFVKLDRQHHLHLQRIMCSVYHLVVVYSSEIILKEKNRSKYQNIQLHSILDLQMSSYPFDICMNI